MNSGNPPRFPPFLSQGRGNLHTVESLSKFKECCICWKRSYLHQFRGLNSVFPCMYALPPAWSSWRVRFGALPSGILPSRLTLQKTKNQETPMNWDQLEGKWKQQSGKVKEKWGKLTDDDLTVIHGQREQLIGKIQERYGIVKEEAERQVDEFARSFRSEEAAEEKRQREQEAEIRANAREKKRSAGQS